jgi:hypothetical protein
MPMHFKRKISFVGNIFKTQTFALKHFHHYQLIISNLEQQTKIIHTKMKRKLTILFTSLFFAGQISAQDLPSELQTPEVVSVNRLPMRASAFAFENQDLAAKRAKEKSAYFLSLNGTWKFNWVKDPRKRPADFYKVDFDDKGWDNFKVPANWEVNGYGTPTHRCENESPIRYSC